MQILLVGVDRNTFPIESGGAGQPLYADDLQEALDFLSHIETDIVILDCSRGSDQELEANVRTLKEKVDRPLVALVRDESGGSNHEHKKRLFFGSREFHLTVISSSGENARTPCVWPLICCCQGSRGVEKTESEAMTSSCCP